MRLLNVLHRLHIEAQAFADGRIYEAVGEGALRAEFAETLSTS